MKINAKQCDFFRFDAETNAKSRWNRCEINVTSMWNQCEINANIDATSMWNRGEADVKSMWTRCETNENSMRNRCEINAKSMWDRFEINVKSMWNHDVPKKTPPTSLSATGWSYRYLKAAPLPPAPSEVQQLSRSEGQQIVALLGLLKTHLLLHGLSAKVPWLVVWLVG